MSQSTAKKELNLDEKVTVRSISNSFIGFQRVADGAIGDISIPKRGTARLTRNEIIAQVQNNNVLFTGIDGKGSHASLIIEDAPTRIEVDFESEDGSLKQEVFSNDLVKELFKISNQTAFERNLKDAIRTKDEKSAIIEAIKELKLNDYSKIRYIENYTGYSI